MARPRREEKCQLCPELATRAVGAIRIGEQCFGRLIDICADAGVTISPDDYRPSNRINGSTPMSVNLEPDEVEEFTGAQIKALREKKGWDVTELARRADVHTWQIEQWEAGERSPQARTRERLLKAFSGEVEAPAQLTKRAHTHKATRAKNAAAKVSIPSHGTNGKQAPAAHEQPATIVLDATDFNVVGDGTPEDDQRLEHAFRALESMWRITGALVEMKLPPGRHRITPAIAEIVLGQRG